MATKHKIRDKKGRIIEVESSPRKAIRRHCIECMCFIEREVANCTAVYCPLYAFRSGKNEELTEERREALRATARKRFPDGPIPGKTVQN